MDPRSLRCSLRAGLAILWLALSVISLSASAGKSPGGVRYGSGSEIILQGFHWNSSRMPTA